MIADNASGPELDEATIAFAGRVFDLARAGASDELAELIRQGVPANLTNSKGDTLLILAAYHGHETAVRMLLGAGADPDRVNDRGQNALGGAAFKGALPVMQILVDQGAAVDGCGPDGRTALMIAAMFDRSEAVELLLDSGADPARADANGITALVAAEKTGAYGTSKRLKAALAARAPSPQGRAESREA